MSPDMQRQLVPIGYALPPGLMAGENRLTFETSHSSSIAHRLISPQDQVLECSPFSCMVCVHVLSTLNSQGCESFPREQTLQDSNWR